MNKEKVIQLVEHKNEKTLTSWDDIFLDLVHTLNQYKRYIVIFFIGFIIGILI